MDKVKSHPLNPRDFRDALGNFASGITVVTGMFEGEPVGFTCQSFYSVSMDPPLVSFSVMKSSSSYPKIKQGATFGVNVLSKSQHALATQFARSGTDKWKGVSWVPAPVTESPLLDEALMWVECEPWAEYEAGDHLIVLGRVVGMPNPAELTHDPLLFFRGKFRHLAEVMA